jgi:pimeloyl-ACP methyl ester carboxylesterase
MSTLPSQRVGDPSGRQCLVLHGILGTKTNWRTVMRAVAERTPGWGFVLPDLRNHGDAPPLAPPHTLDAAADDLDALGAFDAIIGHSYGGKVSLAWAVRTPSTPRLVVTVDSNPGARPDRRGAEGTMRVVDALAAMGGPYPSRDAFTQELIARGFTRDLAAWVAMNVVARDGQWRLRTDVTAIRAMLDDYFARDLWSVVEAPPGSARMLAIVGGASTSLDNADRERLAHAAAHHDRVSVAVVTGAGHWVHVDAPEQTVTLLADALRSV